MKFSSVLMLAGTASAVITISPFPKHLKRGGTYELEYTTDEKYSLELDLVKKGTEPNIAWTQVSQIFTGKRGKPGRATYKVTVNDSWPTSDNGELYALWLDGNKLPAGGGWADLTDWFTVGDGDASDESDEAEMLVSQQELL